MKVAKLSTISQPDCTLGVLTFEGFRCFTLELPWRNNMTSISGIPAGYYECAKVVSPKFGECVSVKNVCMRTHILIHKGNYTKHTQGCILVGKTIADINGDGIPDVTHSAETFKAFMAAVPDAFILHKI